MATGDMTGSIDVAGQTRTYLAHVPQAINCGADSVPLLVALHGEGSSAQALMQLSQFNALAERHGFVVVYPNGSGDSPSWNAGSCCGPAADNKVDDVAFMRALVESMLGTYRGNPKRVYVTGFSNGAMLAYRLASELPDKVAAIAPVAGASGTEERRPGQSVSVLAINGDADPQISNERALKSVQLWAQADGCAPVPERQENDSVIQQTFSGCKGSSAVVFYSIKKLGHAWPPEIVPNSQQSTQDLIWSFLAAHPKP